MSDPADKMEGPANPQVPEGEGQRMFAFIKQRNPAASGPASVVSADYYAAAAAPRKPWRSMKNTVAMRHPRRRAGGWRTFWKNCTGDAGFRSGNAFRRGKLSQDGSAC